MKKDIDKPIYGGDQSAEYKLRFSQVGYEILDDGKPSNKITATSQVVKKDALIAKDKLYSDYKWPYMDSYVPQAKMLERDA